jgi:uncharacterized protein (TIGR00369 family)
VASLERPGIRFAGGRLEVEPHHCFACGSLNTHGLHLELHAADGRCWTELELPQRFQGWDGIAHGGIICTILDEVMAWALVEHDLWGVTARMSVEFKRPVPIEHPVRAIGELREARRRVVTATGRIVDAVDDTLLATSEATFVGATPAKKAELQSRYAVRVIPEPRPGQPA